MNTNYLQVRKKSMMLALQNHQPGEICYCMEDEQFYEFNGSEWILTTNPNEAPSENKVGISQYQLNQQYIANKEPLTEQEKEEKVKLINDWLAAQSETTYMMYGKEISYFTVFAHSKKYLAPQDFKTLGEGVLECLDGLSGNQILIIDKSDNNNAIEIWVKYQGRQTLLYLFPYDGGMVTYG